MVEQRYIVFVHGYVDGGCRGVRDLAEWVANRQVPPGETLYMWGRNNAADGSAQMRLVQPLTRALDLGAPVLNLHALYPCFRAVVSRQSLVHRRIRCV